jgi:hypothetical protein
VIEATRHRISWVNVPTVRLKRPVPLLDDGHGPIVVEVPAVGCGGRAESQLLELKTRSEKEIP